jgi:hypothetical protein
MTDHDCLCVEETALLSGLLAQTRWQNKEVSYLISLQWTRRYILLPVFIMIAHSNTHHLGVYYLIIYIIYHVRVLRYL